MKRKYLLIFVMCFYAIQISSQGIHFKSFEFECAIRQHLGLDMEEQVTEEHLDTITKLDLSGCGINNIIDVLLLPNLQIIDLSNNLIDNVVPLHLLDSLREVNLSNNELESISMLSFSYTKEMYVDVAFNYIKDFSCFNTLTHCNFTINGAGLQYEKNAPYFNVYQFFADINEKDKIVVSYRGYTNMVADITLKYASDTIPVALDGEFRSIEIQESSVPRKVILSNGEVGDTTYVVPPKEFTADAGKTITLETDLPEDYRLSSAYASKGTVEILGNTMKYTSSDDASSDIIEFCYYQGTTFKGMSRFYINREPREDILGDVNNDGTVDISDYIGIANYILGSPPEGFNEAAADVNEDHVIDISDYIGVANIILTGKP